MKNIIGLTLLLSLSTAFAQTTPAGKDPSGAAMGNSATTGNSKSETGSMGTTGSQVTTTDGAMDAVAENTTCTTKSGKDLTKNDKGYRDCLKTMKKK